MQVLAGYWDAIGIKTKVIPIENAEIGQYIFVRSNPRNKEVLYGAITPFIYSAALNNVYHSSNMYCSWGVHSTSNDKKADELYNRLVNEIDPDKAIEYFRDFQEYGRSMYVTIGTLMIYDQYVVGKRIGEFSEKWHMGLMDSLAGMTHAK